MRKIYKTASIAFFGILLSVTNSTAQSVSTFENLTLSPDSFWDGSDMSGIHNAGKFTSSFSDGTAIYTNAYDTAFGLQFASWTQGFAYSNMTDNITAGFGNQHSARTAIGVNNSNNYGLAVQDNFNGVFPIINLTGTAENNTVSGLYVTNTTFAAISIRDGDFAGKIFGDSLDANGNNDGTNGEDWFLLTIKGYTGGNLTPDSVNFYLADFRFTNNALDYIITDWHWVDLTSLGAVDSVFFSLTSSDVGAFGINTPTYFAFDNFNDQTVAIDELNNELNFSIYPNPAKENISVRLNNKANNLQVIDIAGRVIIARNNLSEGTHNLNLTKLNAGIYFIKISNENEMKVERFIKQ